MAQPQVNDGVTLKDRIGELRLAFEHGPIRHLIVPFYQCRQGAELADDVFVKIPHKIIDRSVMAVDEERQSGVVCVLGVAGQVDLLDR